MQMAEIEPQSLEQKIFDLSGQMLALDPGPVAKLRRMEPGEHGPPAYWRLAAKCGFLNGDADRWMQIVKIMAILTPKGERDGTGESDKLHQVKYKLGNGELWRGLGAVLCDGGDPGWRPQNSETADGVVPQKRLARFLAMPADQRRDALERLARTIARTRQRDCGVNCIDIARLILASDPKPTLQKLARDYYQRLDSAARSTNDKEKSV
jgi:CRISPR system Cascade subunit CasB